MHWAFEAAQKIISRQPDAEHYTCASGVSPSGYVHVGNFREIATTFFVTEALKALGKEPRFILSWDDYDRLRKIPHNVTGVDPDAIGLPYTKIPSPDQQAASYGAYFEAQFEAGLRKLGIQPAYIYETQRYEGGAYDEALKQIMDERLAIYDIIARFRTETPDAAERAAYYPISLYCDTCGHDSTVIEDYDSETASIHYHCTRGHSGTQQIGQGQRIKLHWKVDWPMRWRYEQVQFEPGGKDHSSKNGSFDVAKAIAKELFDYEAPVYEPYDFVNIKGSHAKMSSSVGNILTLDELLSVYTPEVVLYLYAKYQPRATFDLGLDEDVLRNYAAYEQLRQQVAAGQADENLTQTFQLTGGDGAASLSFSHVVSLLSLTGNDQTAVAELLVKEGQAEAEIQELLPRAAYWLTHYAPERVATIRETFDQATYDTLTPAVKTALHQFVDLLAQAPEDLMQAVYDLFPETDKKAKREAQKALFQAIYQLVLGSTSGPRINLLVSLVGPERLTRLLVPSA